VFFLINLYLAQFILSVRNLTFTKMTCLFLNCFNFLNKQKLLSKMALQILFLKITCLIHLSLPITPLTRNYSQLMIMLLGINQQQITCVCLLGLSAAFDSMDHYILIERPSSWFGISGISKVCQILISSQSFHVKMLRKVLLLDIKPHLFPQLSPVYIPFLRSVPNWCNRGDSVVTIFLWVTSSPKYIIDKPMTMCGAHWHLCQ
jgi:hypothetical protein